MSGYRHVTLILKPTKDQTENPLVTDDSSLTRQTKSKQNQRVLSLGTITDDTAQALCIARSLVEHQGFDPADVPDRFVA